MPSISAVVLKLKNTKKENVKRRAERNERKKHSTLLVKCNFVQLTLNHEKLNEEEEEEKTNK